MALWRSAPPTAGRKPGLSTTDIRTRFDDYSGAYVLHCHFLGHEDRGMMTNVQTVCPDYLPTDPANAPIWFGVTDPDGGSDDCENRITELQPMVVCPGITPTENDGD